MKKGFKKNSKAKESGQFCDEKGCKVNYIFHHHIPKTNFVEVGRFKERAEKEMPFNFNIREQKVEKREYRYTWSTRIGILNIGDLSNIITASIRGTLEIDSIRLRFPYILFEGSEKYKCS